MWRTRKTTCGRDEEANYIAFNGGPVRDRCGCMWRAGAAARRDGDVGNLLPPPYKFVDNEASIWM